MHEASVICLFYHVVLSLIEQKNFKKVLWDFPKKNQRESSTKDLFKFEPWPEEKYKRCQHISRKISNPRLWPGLAKGTVYPKIAFTTINYSASTSKFLIRGYILCIILLRFTRMTIIGGMLCNCKKYVDFGGPGFDVVNFHPGGAVDVHFPVGLDIIVNSLHTVKTGD